MTEDKMVGWHHRLNGHEFEKTPGDSEGQEKEMTEDEMVRWHHRPFSSQDNSMRGALLLLSIYKRK